MNTSILSNLNWLHILVAALAYFALGSIWYSFLFGKRWVSYQNINMNDPEAKKGAGVIMAGSFVLMFIATIGLAILVSELNLTRAISGVKLGLVTGVCFSSTAISISYVYVKKAVGLHIIDDLYHILGQIITAIILCTWH